MKEYENKQYLWFKISKNENRIRIETCFFTPQVSKTYKNEGLDMDLYATLKQYIGACSQYGEVILVGDFNARTSNQQARILCCKENHNLIWLTEEKSPQWMRCSEDDKVRNNFGEELLTLCGAFT